MAGGAIETISGKEHRMIDKTKFLNFMVALEEAGAEHVSFDDLRKFVEESDTDG